MTTTTAAPEQQVPDTQGRPPAGAPSPVLRPSRPTGLQMLGPYQGSGSERPPYLVRRSDGQVLQISPLLYAVLEALDGERSSAEVAEEVSRSGAGEVDVAGVRYLVEHKLEPLGLVDFGLPMPPPPRANPLLSVHGRTPLLQPAVTQAVAAVLQPLFRPPVVVASLVALVALDLWLLLTRDLVAGVRDVTADPGLALAVFAVTFGAAAFHELGHAAGCRYGGGRPGVIGAGLYLVFPAFYTDVTDSYRLGRTARLRTDLGGLHFHALAVLALGGAYAVTGADWLVLALVAIQLEMLHQLLPLVRFDGYHVLADIVGVPDLFARIGPVLRGAVRRGASSDPRVTGLRPWVRVTVTVWVALVVPFLVIGLSLLLWHLPRLLGMLVAGVTERGAASLDAALDGRVAAALAEGLNGLILVLMLAGVAYVLQMVVRRLAGAAWRWAARSRRRRAVVLGVGGVVVTGLAWGWVATGAFAW